ncbi:conserved hypothetical protein [Tenacibaculum maritimum]|uniref:restriction endonuclease subunit S n=1 Tax=Tenacibaculum maritimum TaxID=107401 RepID=UPI0012E528ED|nr:restriction endonuclease subunit S [Tenacibaculum maritimum]CAA0155377.1 conserved hypothetical protein [Tenacibaculum maritimum]
MELATKQGFKQTEVGLIPEDWSLKNIGDLSTIFGRIGFRGYTVNDIVKEDQGAITLSPSNIVNGQLNLSKVTFLSWFKYEESPEIKIYNGDILLVKTGSTFGKTALVKNLDQKATLNPQIIVLKKIKCDNVFLGYMMGYPIIQNQITSTVVGGAIPTLSQEQVSRFQIPLPPTLKEQKAIATALSDMDDLIASLESLIAKKQAIKQGAMQQLLTPPHKGGKRLPGFSGDWVEKSLGEIVFLNKGEQVNRDTLSEQGSYPVINGGVEPSGYTEEWNRKENTITISEGGNSCGFVNFLKTKFWSGGHCYTLNINSPEITKDYLYVFLKFNESEIMSLRVGSGLPNIQKGRLESFLCAYPNNTNEQKAIAKILSDMDAELEQLETKKAKYQQLKQGMLQELLTGNTRLV